MQDWIEYFGVITGLLYLLLEIKQSPTMWIVGIISSLLYIIIFYNAKIYADMTFNGYYLLMSFYGFILWQKGKKKGEKKKGENENTTITFQYIKAKTFFILLAIFLLVYAVIYGILLRYTDSPIPLADALTTSLSIVATWMLAHKIIEHWVLWVIINSISIYIYAIRGLYPTVFLYICYAILSFAGYYQWRKKGIEKP